MLRPSLAGFAVSVLVANLLQATPGFAAEAEDTLTGDWFGAGQTLREQGVYASGGVTQFYQGLVAGDGEHRWASGGKLDGFLRLDGEQLGLWQGFGVHAHGEFNYGHSLTDTGGALLPSNTALTFPGANEQLTDLSLYFSQELSDSATALLGKINMLDMYDAGREFSGGRGIEQFQHIEFIAPISGITPPMIFGSIISLKTDPAKFTLMIYDPQSQTRQTGLEHPFEQGQTLNGSVELPSQFFGKSGKHIFSAAYSTQNGMDFRDVPELLLPDAAANTQPREKGHRWFYSYAFEQTLWRDAGNPERGWGLFGQAGVSDANPNPVGWSVMGGIGGSSPLTGRELDKFGVGAFYLSYSDVLKEDLQPILPVRDESGLEVFYNLAATPWLRLTADTQWLQPTNSDRARAVISSLRMQVIF